MELWMVAIIVGGALTWFPAGALAARIADPLAAALIFVMYWIFGDSASYGVEESTVPNADRRLFMIGGWATLDALALLFSLLFCAVLVTAAIYWGTKLEIWFWRTLEKFSGIKN